MSAGMPSPGLSKLQTVIWAVGTILVGAGTLLSLVLLWLTVGQGDHRPPSAHPQNMQTRPAPEEWRMPEKSLPKGQPNGEQEASEDLPPWVIPGYPRFGQPRPWPSM